MLSFPAGFKIFLALEPTDMRKQFNGLWAAAATQLREDPRQGAVFVFTNRERDQDDLDPLLPSNWTPTVAPA